MSIILCTYSKQLQVVNILKRISLLAAKVIEFVGDMIEVALDVAKWTKVMVNGKFNQLNLWSV